MELIFHSSPLVEIVGTKLQTVMSNFYKQRDCVWLYLVFLQQPLSCAVGGVLTEHITLSQTLQVSAWRRLQRECEDRSGEGRTSVAALSE